MHPEARAIVNAFGLAPHPEGGFYRETFRSLLEVESSQHAGSRSASTAIYFLLPAGSYSAFHRVRGSDEVWGLLRLILDDDDRLGVDGAGRERTASEGETA